MCVLEWKWGECKEGFLLLQNIISSKWKTSNTLFVKIRFIDLYLQNQQLYNVDACSRPILVYQCPIKQDWVKFEHQSNITPPPANSKTLQNKVRYFEVTRTSGDPGAMCENTLRLNLTGLLYELNLLSGLDFYYDLILQAWVVVPLKRIISIWLAWHTWIIQIVLTLLYLFQMDFHSTVKASMKMLSSLLNK